VTGLEVDDRKILEITLTQVIWKTKRKFLLPGLCGETIGIFGSFKM
jgi:hypothetical protein